jgi:hypothetical protein
MIIQTINALAINTQYSFLLIAFQNPKCPPENRTDRNKNTEKQHGKIS